MKGVLACFAFLGLLMAPALADQTEVGGGIILVHGAHTEHADAHATASAVPAILVYGRHRFGRWSATLESIPGGTARVCQNSLGLNHITLSYIRPSISYDVAARTTIGLSEIAYNQRTNYGASYAPAPSGVSLERWDEVDASRVAGASVDLSQTLYRSHKNVISLQASYSPRLTATLSQTNSYRYTNGYTYSTPSSQPESGSRLELMLDAAVRAGKRTTFHYGVRYLNMNMHFSDGSLADRNAFIVPFLGWSTTLGR